MDMKERGFTLLRMDLVFVDVDGHETLGLGAVFWSCLYFMLVDIVCSTLLYTLLLLNPEN